MTIALSLAALVAIVWGFDYLKERDAEKATERFSERFVGVSLGAVGAIVVVMDYLAIFASEIMAIIIGIPSLFITLLGIGALSGAAEMSPGMFAIAALITYLLARAMGGR